MTIGPNIASVGALMGDPARANILTSLMGGQALTATELAHVAGVTGATASGHLGQLLAGGLLTVEKQGRHRYYRLAGPDVAAAIEALMDLVAQSGQRRVRTGPRDPEMRRARVCYDHLAGERGVELFTKLTRLQLITLDENGIAMTQRGEQAFRDVGIDTAALRAAKRPVCKTCIDWSERRTHLAGGLGARLLDRMFELSWAKRSPDSRIVKFTPRGEDAFARLFE